MRSARSLILLLGFCLGSRALMADVPGYMVKFFASGNQYAVVEPDAVSIYDPEQPAPLRRFPLGAMAGAYDVGAINEAGVLFLGRIRGALFLALDTRTGAMISQKVFTEAGENQVQAGPYCPIRLGISPNGQHFVAITTLKAARQNMVQFRFTGSAFLQSFGRNDDSKMSAKYLHVDNTGAYYYFRRTSLFSPDAMTLAKFKEDKEILTYASQWSQLSIDNQGHYGYVWTKKQGYVIHDLASGSELPLVGSHNFGYAFADRDGKLLIAATDGTVTLWDSGTQETRNLPVARSNLSQIDLSATFSYVAVAHRTGVAIFRTDSNQEVKLEHFEAKVRNFDRRKPFTFSRDILKEFGASDTPEIKGRVKDIRKEYERRSLQVFDAVLSGDTQTLARSLEQGWDVGFRDKENQTAVIVAARSGKGAILEQLTAAGASLEARHNNQTSILLLALAGQHGDIGELLLRKSPSLLEEPLREEATPLAQGILDRDAYAVHWLLEHRANPSITSKDGRSLCVQAADCGDREIIAEVLRTHPVLPKCDELAEEAAHGWDFQTAERWLTRGVALGRINDSRQHQIHQLIAREQEKQQIREAQLQAQARQREAERQARIDACQREVRKHATWKVVKTDDGGFMSVGTERRWVIRFEYTFRDSNGSNQYRSYDGTIELWKSGRFWANSRSFNSYEEAFKDILEFTVPMVLCPRD